jgi:hypothetical protein
MLDFHKLNFCEYLLRYEDADAAFILDNYCAACQKRERDRIKNDEKYCDFPGPKMVPIQILIHSKIKIVHDILLQSTNPDYKDLAHRLE